MQWRNWLGTVLILIALGIVVYLSLGTPDPVSYNPGFFSDDGGSTFFMAATSKITPFEHDGKEAVHADVFTCDKNETRFVGFLDRYTSAMKQRLEHPPADKAELLALMREAANNGVEVVAPHSDHWVMRDSPEGQRIIDAVRCPRGSQNNLTWAWPKSDE
ncbi:MAG TPA: hypothetical protein VGG19_01365 [Tepidisphaeraceae bacterium]|jgi:hypothetical protein